MARNGLAGTALKIVFHSGILLRDLQLLSRGLFQVNQAYSDRSLPNHFNCSAADSEPVLIFNDEFTNQR
jgi:hypothetical protein